MLLKGDTLNVMRDLNAKMDSDNTSLGHMMGKCRLADCNEKVRPLWIFIALTGLLLVAHSFEHRACYNV